MNGKPKIAMVIRSFNRGGAEVLLREMFENKIFNEQVESYDLIILDSKRVELLKDLKNVRVKGLMGMASLTENELAIKTEFRYLHSLFENFDGTSQTVFCQPSILSMGMSSDYELAIEEGTNMVRIGSLIFGERTQTMV